MQKLFEHRLLGFNGFIYGFRKHRKTLNKRKFSAEVDFR